jgi:Bacterial Ig domain
MENVVKRLIVPAIALLALAGCGGTDAGSGSASASAKAATPDPANQLPFGVLDAPAANAVVARQFRVSGWAVDDTGVTAVRLYIDGHYAGTTTLTIDRPDVSAAVPTLAHGGNRHGWQINLIAEPGAHNILAQAVDKAGATRDLGSVPVTVRP